MKTKNRIRSCLLIVIGLILILTEDCNKSDQGQVPKVFTRKVSQVMPFSAYYAGEITSNGGSRLTEQGFCWSTLHLPVITDNKIVMSFQDVVRYAIKVYELNQQTEYYVKAYAMNNIGTAYGEELTFTTPEYKLPGEPGTVTDTEGNVYQTISIGSQVWMAENLKTTRYRNGDSIRTTTPATLPIRGLEDSTEKYQWAYIGDESMVATYGRLYTWPAVTDKRNVCPEGWHVPTESELFNLITYVGNENEAGGTLKERGTDLWHSPNYGATNYFGFTALPGGYRNVYEEFTSIGYDGFWWYIVPGWENHTASVAPCWNIKFGASILYITLEAKWSALSVRCLKDN